MKIVRFVSCLLVPLLIIVCIVACSSPDASAADSSFEQSLVQYLPLEKLPKTDLGSFSIHRDPVTDVLYLASKTGYAGGLTVMLDPDSGLPLTYQRYLELYYQD